MYFYNYFLDFIINLIDKLTKRFFVLLILNINYIIANKNEDSNTKIK